MSPRTARGFSDDPDEQPDERERAPEPADEAMEPDYAFEGYSTELLEKAALLPIQSASGGRG